jgi:CMP-N-acetylneuraminic acid synthetase
MPESPLEIVALVPMRHHSERVAGKNYRPLAGRPLFHYVLQTLQACPSISRIVIDTDSPVIARDARANFPAVQILDRPSELCADDVPMTEILAHDVTQVPSDWYVQTHSTNPFLRAETIEQGLSRLRAAWPAHDSLFTVTRLQARLWTHDGRPMNHDPERLLQTQKLDPVFLENSCLYVFPGALIRDARRRIGSRPLLLDLDPLEALDIDEERDFRMAERLMPAIEPAALADASPRMTRT